MKKITQKVKQLNLNKSNGGKMDKLATIKESALLLERILKYVHKDDYKSNIAVNIKSRECVDVEAICKKMRVKKDIKDYIIERFEQDWYWVNICKSAVSQFKEKFLKKFSCCEREEIYQFGRSGGWISLALAEPFFDVCESVDWLLEENHIAKIYAKLLGDEEEREDALAVINDVYEQVSGLDCKGMLKAIEYTEEAHRKFSFEKYIRADIRRKIRETKEYEERKAA